jgi:hypothetical protein
MKVITNSVKWISNEPNTTGVLDKNNGIVYVSEMLGLGMTHAASKSYIGLTPDETINHRYGGQKGIAKPSAHITVFEDKSDHQIIHDDNIREIIHNKFLNKEITFDAYHPKQNPNPEGMSHELLIDVDHSEGSEHLKQIDEIILDYFNPSNKNDNLPWIPRFGQAEAVEETVERVKAHNKCAVNGYTGFAKTMIASGTVHEFYNTGAFVLFTTPIIDTLNDVKDNFIGYHYPNSVLGLNSRKRHTRVYTKEDLNRISIKEMREQANAGDIVLFAVSVQAIRYKDDTQVEDEQSINSKYDELLDVELDMWIKDERHLQYNGAITEKVFSKLEPNQELDLSASINKIRDQYSPGQIVDRGLFWSIEHRTELKLPEIQIDVLSGAVHEALSESDQDRFSPEFGFMPAKMTEVKNGILVSFSAIDSILTSQYIQDDDRDENPLSIRCDETLPEMAKKVGLHVFPQGVNDTSAREYLFLLEAQLNDSPKWNKGKAIFITPYNWEKHINHKVGATTYAAVIEHLSTQHEHVIILTHRKWTTGSNIPPLAHIVAWDKIVCPYNFEQCYPGRAYRSVDGKTHIKYYDLCPGHTITDAFCAIAQKTSSVRKGIPDPVTLLKNLRISKYDGISMKSLDHMELFRDFHDRNFKSLRATVTESKIIDVLSDEETQKLLGLKIKNKALGDTSDKDLTDDNGAERNDKKPKSGKSSKSRRNGAKTINAVMMELPPFIYLEHITDIFEALNHKSVRKMFTNEKINDLIDIVDKNVELYNVLQDKVIALNHAFSTGKPFEEVHDLVFRNTLRKKKAGLVFVNMHNAERLAEMFMSDMELDEAYEGQIAIQNALSGSVAFYLQKKLKCATIICVEHYDYYVDHLNSNGFVVTNSNKLEGKYMAQIKYWFQNPPYQKDASGDNSESNKQGDFWFTFVSDSMMSKASTHDSKHFVISPKGMFGAGYFGTDSYKVTKVRSMGGEFKHLYPCLNWAFPGINQEIGGCVIDRAKTDSIATIDGSSDVIIMDGNTPVPFFVSSLAKDVIAKTWSVHQTMNFKDNLNKHSDDTAVLRVQGGRFKQWKKTTVGYEKDTTNNKNGAIIPEKEIPGFESAINSQLWKYIFKIFGAEAGNSPTKFMKHMPVMKDMTRSYTDEEWFNAFNIGSEQQKEILKFNLAKKV